jgi:ArsR family transcriptional regulator, arsenate/arsenite/antimonite-responsive transcriptional repressor / arsenate reductase (thioredoxin)
LASHLAESDQRVNELIDAVGASQNLVSYHLAILKRAGLVTERRSSADARDVYHHLDLDQLGAALGTAALQLHPGLGQTAAEPARRRGKVARRVRVLFICSGNSARSQIAEALLRRVAAGDAEVLSAGPRPAGVHPLTVKVLSEMGLATRGLRSKALEELDGRIFDFVISLCDVAREECSPRSEWPRYIHWSLADPAEVRGSTATQLKAFRRTAGELDVRIRQLMPVLAQVGGDPND